MNISEMDFPRSLNAPVWKKYLGRNLTYEERFIIEDAKSEKFFNQELDKLYSEAMKQGLYISELTRLHGNCLPESLLFHKIGDSVDMLRESIAHLVYVFGNYKDFFETQSETIRELFAFENEVEFVFCSTDKTFYKYTFEVMCQDLSNNNSWTRLPSQTILMVLSVIFKLEIVLLHNNGYMHTINANKPETLTTKIHLGLIGESHYVPLAYITTEKHLETPKYNDGKIRYFKWATRMWSIVNKKEVNLNKDTRKTITIPNKSTVDTDTFTSITVPQDISDGVAFS